MANHETEILPAMLDEASVTLLRNIFVESTSSPNGVSAIRFRAMHFEHLELIDSLVSSRWIENRDGNYFIFLASLPEIADSTPQVNDLFALCEHIFNTLRKAYLSNPGASISLDDLSKLANLPRERLCTAVSYLWEASVICSFTTDLSASDASVTPAEKLLKHKSFSHIVDEMRSWRTEPVTAHNPFIPSPNMFSILGSNSTFEHLLHPEISQHALPQYNNGHLRDAVLNSITAVFDLIRQRTGLTEDGSRLIGKALSLECPYLILSEIETESGKSDQQGFMQILIGAYQGIRNPKAHSLSHNLTEVAAAQYLVLASLLARRIEEAKVIDR